MVKVMPAAPLDGPKLLPAELIDNYVKPDAAQTVLINAFRLAALGWVEQHTKQSLSRRPWVATFDRFSLPIELPIGPVRGVVSLRYLDAAGVAADGIGFWRLDGSHVVPVIGSGWPQFRGAGAVTIEFEAGYDDLATEAPALQVAALMLVMHLLNGGSLNDIPETVSLLLDEPYRTPVMA